MPKKQEKLVTIDDALKSLSSSLMKGSNTERLGKFYPFVRDIWSQGYEHPEYFKYWHVQYICEKLEESLDEHKNFVAVLPRFHFKSTILGYAFAIWFLLSAKRDCSLLYTSYNDRMSIYHISEIKKIVRRNPKLKQWLLKDLSPRAVSSFKFQTNNGNLVEILGGGLFAFKRGMHTQGAIADDILKDPDNPVALGELEKIASHFKTETMNIPPGGFPVIVLGTPMVPDDLLTQLRDDDRFNYVLLPALDPIPGRRVLMPEVYDERWLLAYQAADRASFASQFLLSPHYSTDSYFSDDEITSIEVSGLPCLRVNVDNTEEVKKYDYVVAGFDVGKRRHPSHLAIFGVKDNSITQLHQSFLDHWDYVKQVEYLNTAARNFNVNKGFIDNTRGELDDRGLDRMWTMQSFTSKLKNQIAQKLEKYVVNKTIRLIPDSRQHQQILSVTRDLQAASTPTGHGDAFFSISLAALAASEYDQYGKGFQDIGNMQSMIVAPTQPEDDLQMKTPPWSIERFKGLNPKVEPPKCPKCLISGGFIIETQTCLVCRYKGLR